MSASRGRSVLILVQNLSVPFDRRVWQEARSLTRAGYSVVVICPQGVGRDEEPFEVLEGVEIHRYPLAAVTSGLVGYLKEYAVSFLSTRRLVRQVARSRKFAVVHACNPPDFLLLTALGIRRRGATFIFDHHDLVPELYLSRFRRGRDFAYWLTRIAEWVTFRLADVVISTNDSYRAVALRRGGLDPQRVFVVRSAPDLRRFQPAPAQPELRRGKDHLIAYLGVMGPQDGIDHGLWALAELRRRRADWHAIFVGSGDVFDQMRALCSRLGLDDFVEFTGRVPNEHLLAVLSTADVALAPDPSNPLNDVSTMNKIMEYMALGLPIVSYDLPEARVSAASAAIYAQPNDPVSFATAIDELLSSPERREAMGGAGRERCARNLAWEHSERALLRAYDHALALGAHRSSQRTFGQVLESARRSTTGALPTKAP